MIPRSAKRFALILSLPLALGTLAAAPALAAGGPASGTVSTQVIVEEQLELSISNTAINFGSVEPGTQVGDGPGFTTDDAGTYSVISNDPNGYQVTIIAPTPDVFKGQVSGSTLPADGNNGINVFDSAIDGTPYEPIPNVTAGQGGSLVIASSKNRSGPNGDVFSAGYKFFVPPGTPPDTYTAQFNVELLGN
jgi:hypothetical protein